MEKILRKIIFVDEEKCDGCGLCIPSCAEGALQIVDGKARLVKDIYCDGLGNCLGECPLDAISIIEREADPFDEEAVEEHLATLENIISAEQESDCGVCCGSVEREISPPADLKKSDALPPGRAYEPEAELSHWPIQLHLVAPQSRFLKEADLLIAADCVPFAYADFHRSFLAGKALIIGCPKLDDVKAYQQKLVQIFKLNDLKSITLVHMEVPCCFGLSQLVKSALIEAGVDLPVAEVIVGVDGVIK